MHQEHGRVFFSCAENNCKKIKKLVMKKKSIEALE